MMKVWDVKVLKAPDRFLDIPGVVVLEDDLMDLIRELCDCEETALVTPDVTELEQVVVYIYKEASTLHRLHSYCGIRFARHVEVAFWQDFVSDGSCNKCASFLSNVT